MKCLPLGLAEGPVDMHPLSEKNVWKRSKHVDMYAIATETVRRKRYI